MAKWSRRRDTSNAGREIEGDGRTAEFDDSRLSWEVTKERTVFSGESSLG